MTSFPAGWLTWLSAIPNFDHTPRRLPSLLRARVFALKLAARRQPDLGASPAAGCAARAACAPGRCRSRLLASAPCRSCRTSRASLGRRTASAVSRNLGGQARRDAADAGPRVEPGAQGPEARSYENTEHPAKPSAATRRRPRIDRARGETTLATAPRQTINS